MGWGNVLSLGNHAREVQCWECPPGEVGRTVVLSQVKAALPPASVVCPCLSVWANGNVWGWGNNAGTAVCSHPMFRPSVTVCLSVRLSGRKVVLGKGREEGGWEGRIIKAGGGGGEPNLGESLWGVCLSVKVL